MNEGFEAPLRIANKKHDLVAVRINDKREERTSQCWLSTNERCRKGKHRMD